MSTLQVRTPFLPKARLPWGALTRIASAIATVLDVFNEALAQAHEAQRRYPFTSW